ncbi:MAG: OstA-like protein [Bacteroidota bacterium]
MRIVLILFCWLGVLLNVEAQNRPPTVPRPDVVEQDTTDKDRVIVDFSDYAEGNLQGEVTRRILYGNVQLRQDSTYMYCDSAVLIDNNVFAYGEVLIQQQDSVFVFSDSLIYKGDEKIADLFGEVVMVNKEQKLFTNRLNYDLNKKLATYRSGATLQSDSTQLTSKVGYYFTETKEAFFKDSVFVVDSTFSLRADTLKFNSQSKIVTFLGPTRINQKDSKIYCESGFYNTENRTAEFRENAQYLKGTQRATADVIRYDESKEQVLLDGNAYFEDGEKIATAKKITYLEAADITLLEGDARYRDATQDIVADAITYNSAEESFSTRGRSTVIDPPQILMADSIDFDQATSLGLALGNVYWRDTAQDMSINCERADYNKDTDYFKASGGRPLLTTLMADDTLFMRSDTLISFIADTTGVDSSRTMLAYRDVKIFKSDMQALCDSLSYDTRDSVFSFYDNPIVWSDTSQFTADTMHMIMNNGEIDTIFLIDDGYIINSEDEKFFNQIKGKNITAFFVDNELRRMKVEGNAESVYYALDDDKAYIGVNKTVCSEMLLYFGNNEVERIKFFAQPKAKLQPMDKANHNELKLKGFRWDIARRPASKEAL